MERSLRGTVGDVNGPLPGLSSCALCVKPPLLSAFHGVYQFGRRRSTENIRVCHRCCGAGNGLIGGLCSNVSEILTRLGGDNTGLTIYSSGCRGFTRRVARVLNIRSVFSTVYNSALSNDQGSGGSLVPCTIRELNNDLRGSERGVIVVNSA